ncbi:MAG TPA: hypothetical protein VFE32_19885 [Puia sp.]|jgi:hypothetical protein|nr:hypothetical protein [Puia sp.]
MTGVTRFTANFFSYLFHPLFISSYVMGFLIFFHPMAFSEFDHITRVFRFITILACNVFFPLFSVFLMWRLKLFVNSMYLHDQKERIVPYIVAMIFYWWTWYAFKNLPDTPEVAIRFLAGSFFALVAAFLCNIYLKISIHTVALGNALMFSYLFSFTDAYASGLYLSIVLAVTGLVATSRLMVGAHRNFEIWAGLFVGMLAQLVGWYWPF